LLPNYALDGLLRSDTHLLEVFAHRHIETFHLIILSPLFVRREARNPILADRPCPGPIPASGHANRVKAGADSNVRFFLRLRHCPHAAEFLVGLLGMRPTSEAWTMSARVATARQQEHW
jgi:hypothetical protein